jgi:hypothetical protein
VEESLTVANLALRFALELCALWALGYWGAHVAASPVVRVALAIAAPLAAAVAWGAVVAPKARLRAPAGVRLAVELAIFGGATLALAGAGRSRWAVWFAVAVALHELLRALGHGRRAGVTRPP